MSLDISELKSSHIPALQLLAKLGYVVLLPSKALVMRDGSTGNVLLESILLAKPQTQAGNGVGLEALKH